MDRKELAEKRTFSDLMKQFGNDKGTYEKCMEVTESRIAERERLKDLLRSVGLLDDY